MRADRHGCRTIPPMRVRFVSDLHLDAETPAAAEAFLTLLQDIRATAAESPQVLYILGDLFETWIGDDDPDPFRDEICEALKHAHRVGVRLYVMAGNRDFLYGDRFTARTGAIVLPDPTVATLFGERVLLTHGDVLCTDDTAYQELRSTVRDPTFQARLLGLPLEARQRLAVAARAGSRAHTATTAANIMDVNEIAVNAAFETTHTRVMVHGHTHRPGEHTHLLTEGQTATRYVLDAWHTEGGVLERVATGWRRYTIPFPS
jgi:UDP-2,3-diacylglucosamine hydrolase